MVVAVVKQTKRPLFDRIWEQRSAKLLAVFAFPLRLISCLVLCCGSNVFIRGFGFAALSLVSAGRVWRTFQNLFFLIILTNARIQA